MIRNIIINHTNHLSINCVLGLKVNWGGALYLGQKRFISRKTYKFPELLESDLEEKFIHGSGPGGQNQHKTASNVVLRHLPTGICVHSQKTRSQFENQKDARLKLIDKLDELYNGDNCFKALKRAEIVKQANKLKQKNKKKAELKKEFKEREGLD